MKVLICIPCLLRGGTEMQALMLVRVLLAQYHRVRVCCYFETDPQVVTEFKEAGAFVSTFGWRRSMGLLAFIRRLSMVIRREHPDIVHVQYMAPGLMAIIAARLAGVRRVLATVHQPATPYGLKEKIYLRAAARLCAAFFCVSRAVESSWFGDSKVFDPRETNLTRKHFTIYNGVDVDRIARCVNLPGHASRFRNGLGITDRPTVGVVGRLRKEKGQGVLLEAMADVVTAIPSTCLIIVGDGPDREGLRDKADRLGLVDHVLWLGKRMPEELYALHSLMDVVVVPSIFEGLGLSAIEAMAAGRPVVASAVDGLREVVEDGITGYLVPPSDITSLAKAVISLLSDKAKARSMGEEGRRRAISLFGMERFSESVLAAYRLFSRVK